MTELYLENCILNIKSIKYKTSEDKRIEKICLEKKEDTSLKRTTLADHDRRESPQRYGGNIRLKEMVKLQRAQGGCLGTKSR